MIRNLTGEEEIDFTSMKPSVIVADDLTPSETVQIDKEKVLAFVTAHSSTNSHTSILARMMNIPALIGVPVNLEEIHQGIQAVVDGYSGEVIFEPSILVGKSLCLLQYLVAAVTERQRKPCRGLSRMQVSAA